MSVVPFPQQAGEPQTSHGIVGNNDRLVGAMELVRKAAERGASILLVGEPGTGKDLLARYAHSCSARADAPLIIIDATTIAPSVLESTLLGHARGAFTGATSREDGLVAQANGGVLFIDEIGEIPMEKQGVLLPVLEKGEYRSVGCSAVHQVDFMLVSATNKDLAREVQAGRFRLDLLDRLAEVTVHVPPLRERRGDIALLAEHIVSTNRRIGDTGICSLSQEALALLRVQQWPGNVRELRNLLVTAAMLSSQGETEIRKEAVECAFRSRGVAFVSPEEFVRRSAFEAIEAGGKVALASLLATTEIPRTTLERLLEAMVRKGELFRGVVDNKVVFVPADACAGASRALAGGQHRHHGGSDLRDRSQVSTRAVSTMAKSKELLALDVARQEGRVTRSMLVEATGMPRDTAYKVLRRLVAKGLLVKEGETGCGAGYLLAG